MRHHLLPMWVVLWRDLGIRPADAGDMTLDDVLVAEIYAEQWEREQRQLRARQARQRR